MKIGIYSGSFNPIHFGHIKLAKYLIDNDLVDEVWLVVSPQNPLKKEADLAEDLLRLKMAEIALKGEKKIKVSDIEFHLPKPSYTIDTLNYLQKKYPENEFCLLIGSDNVAVFDKWKNYTEILQKFSVIVYPREGYEQKTELYQQMIFVDAPKFNISSTEIRERLSKNLHCKEFLPKKIIEFIKNNKIYPFCI
ncbi:MAG: nicotinate-nucleotide adenylyltransferase [Prevotellaceae bacterium]|jgi:nicotinate-nucleotide adenylyltransferase|nr:nicotinate-nucleotide adenylyltransferase [Prevotellaceae bacterium]